MVKTLSNFISATKLQEYSYSLYIVLQIVVNTFCINSCAFLCQRFEISLEKNAMNLIHYYCQFYYTTAWLRQLRRKSDNLQHFACPWVRIQAGTENMSVIFFCADFFTFFYLNCFSHNLGGVHKPRGLSKERERSFFPVYEGLSLQCYVAIPHDDLVRL